MWQDFVLATVSVLFTVFLIPQMSDVLRGQKVNKFTAGSTAMGLLVMAGTFATLDLTFAAITTCATAVVWAVMYLSALRRR